MPRVSVVLFLAFTLPAAAQNPDKAKEDAEAVKKQKAAAAENLKAVKVRQPTLIETDHLLVYAELPEEKLKPIAEAAQKARDRGVKDLRFSEGDRMWAGKLTVYVLADRTKEYTPFVKLIEQRTGKVDADEMQSHALSGEPYVAVTASPTAKAAEADLKAEAMAAVAVALLEQKAGAGLPTWLQVGAGKAIAYRTDGNGRALEAHRARVKAAFAKAKLGTFKAADVWGDTRPADADTLTVSLCEYLLYGADGGLTDRFLGGFRPTDERREPNVGTALAAAEWKAEDLDLAWKKWVLGLK